MNAYEPKNQFEQFVVDELRHIGNHLQDVERDVKDLTGFANKVRGQASLIAAVTGAMTAWVLGFFRPHGS